MKRTPTAICSTLHTLDGPAGAHADNLFLVSGVCEIVSLTGVVETILADGLTVPQLQLWDGAAPVALSTNAGVISLFPPGSFIGKIGDSGDGLGLTSSAGMAILEPAQPVLTLPFLIVPDGQLDTFIRFAFTSAGDADGQIRWRIEYIPHGRGGISAA
jgi:hypothetical protein